MSFEEWYNEKSDHGNLLVSAESVWNAALDEVVKVLIDTGTLSVDGTTYKAIKELKE